MPVACTAPTSAPTTFDETGDESPHALRHTVLLTDGLTGINRVVGLLRQRRYDVRSLTADLECAEGDGLATLTIVVAGMTERDAALMAERLLRLPSVLAARN
jgi:acetolactate synthase small subunit